MNISWRDGKNARGGKMGRIILYLDCTALVTAYTTEYRVFTGAKDGRTFMNYTQKRKKEKFQSTCSKSH